MIKRMIVFILSLVVLISGIFFWAGHHKTATPAKKSTATQQAPNSSKNTGQATQNKLGVAPTAQAIQGIINTQMADPSLQTSGFVLNSTVEAASTWFIVNITPTGTDPQTMLLRQNPDASFTLVAQPSNQIPLSLLQRYNVPQIVINQLSVDKSE